jgi:TRAP-type C4-dicarboxylate transport system permease small subunit
MAPNTMVPGTVTSNTGAIVPSRPDGELEGVPGTPSATRKADIPILTPLNAFLSRMCMKLAVAGLFGIIASVVWQVFGRYVLNDTPVWAESTALLLVIWVTMLGAAAGVRDAGHIGMESLVVLLPAGMQRICEIIIHCLTIVFAVTMIVYGWEIMMSVWEYSIPTLHGLSQGIQYIPVVLAGALICLFSTEQIIATLQNREVEPSWH